MYQPEWRGGQEVGRGDRDCDGRFKAIATELSGVHDFTVLDLGAYAGYFSIRLAEQFNARVTAVDDFPRITRLRHPNVKVINRRLTPEQVDALGDFDVVLCMSLLHHVQRWRAMLDVVTRRARVLFLEAASRHEDLPRAEAHSMELCDAIDALGGKVIARTAGYKNDNLRDLKVIGGLDVHGG